MFLFVTVCRETALDKPAPPKKYKTPSLFEKQGLSARYIGAFLMMNL